MMKNQIKKKIKLALDELGYPSKLKIEIDHPQDEKFGDYYTNVAMVLAKEIKKSPKEIADNIENQILTQMKKQKDEQGKLIEKVNAVGGFVNFRVRKAWLVSHALKAIREGDSYGTSNEQPQKMQQTSSKPQLLKPQSSKTQGQKPQEPKSTTSQDIKPAISKTQGKKRKRIMIEFGQPNTHKIPHIGHLFSYTLGESLARLLQATGNKVYRANYQGDVGLHVAKCLWAYLKDQPKDPTKPKQKVKLLQELYQKGSEAYERSESTKDEIQEINKKLYEGTDQKLSKAWEKTRKWSVDYYKQFEKRLGTHYDRYYFESEVYKPGIKIVKENLGKVFEKSEGAIIFPGEKYGLHNRVFITQYGTPTYEAKDMALQEIKYEEWPFDKLIITTANEQSEYFRVIIKALEMLNPKLFKDKIDHIGFGMVNLKSGKMSSRSGNIITGPGLIEDAVGAVQKKVADREGLSDSEKQKIAEIVGIGAIKYSLLKTNPLQNTSFDFEESISFEGNSGPYLQYTYARCKSILGKAKISNQELAKQIKQNKNLDSFETPEEDAVTRLLYKFPEEVQKAGDEYSPNILCNYLFDLAQKFNLFYKKHSVLEAEAEEIRLFRVLVVSAVAQVMRNGLYLLGIDVLEKM